MTAVKQKVTKIAYYADFSEFIGDQAVYTMTNDDGEDVVVYTLNTVDYEAMGRPAQIKLTISDA